MTIDPNALARRAVACKGWRWRPGMAYWWLDDRDRVADTEPGDLRRDGSLLPDLTDPATLGCILALVREAWGDPRLVVIYHGEAAYPGQSEGWGYSRSASEAEALVAALEAAP